MGPSETPRRLPPPRKALGQHFLASDRAAGAIVDALGDVTGRTVVEIGPGRGILTAVLLRRGARVLGIELDGRLAAYLGERFAGSSALEIVRGDVLTLDLSAVARERSVELPLTVVGNIPYRITSPLLRKLLAIPGELARAVLMLQREVAERLLAPLGTSAYGSLTVGVRAVADVTPVLTLSPSKFRPPPKVWSSVVRLDARPDGPDASEREALERLTKLLFSGRRKQLQKILRQSGLVVEGELDDVRRELDLPLSVRPEGVPVEAFLKLLRFLRRGGKHPW